MKVREHTDSRLVLRASGFDTRHWGIVVSAIAGLAAVTLATSENEAPLMAVLVTAFFLITGLPIAIFSRYRLAHVLDKDAGEGRVEYPTAFSFGREITTFKLSDVVAIRPTSLSAFAAAVSRTEHSRAAGGAQGGFSYILSDGTEIEAGEFTTARKEVVTQIQATSEFLGVPIERSKDEE